MNRARAQMVRRATRLGRRPRIIWHLPSRTDHARRHDSRGRLDRMARCLHVPRKLRIRNRRAHRTIHATATRRLRNAAGWHEIWRWTARRSTAKSTRAIEQQRLDAANSYTRGEALRTRAIWLLIVGYALHTLAILAVLVHTIPFKTDSGFTRTEAALAIALNGGANLRPS